MTGDCHVRFCESRGVRLPPATHQALRPAVVARKAWGGNRTAKGAHTQQVLMSVCRTCRQQGVDPVTVIVGRLRQQIPGVAPELSLPGRDPPGTAG